jgi:hypothetical protein
MAETPNARRILLDKVQAYAKSQLQAAASESLSVEALMQALKDLRPDEIARVVQQLTEANALQERRSWLKAVLELTEPQPRTRLAFTPSWSFAGDLCEVARTIEQLVSLTVPPGAGRGSKDDLPMVYVCNPPRHGKSLLLDRLFPDDHNVCVLAMTYNAASHIPETEYTCEKAALKGLCLRLLQSLLFPEHHKMFNLPNSPFAATGDPVALFQEMLGLLTDSGDAPTKVLICIDEVSKLLDDERCTWASDKLKMKSFWQGLYSVTRATPNWVRVVMTGFTDTPNNAIASSDVASFHASLSMMTTPEREQLAAELVWAYAAKNVVFPGLLWSLVKSTPGLLGLWAQHVRLHLETPPNDAAALAGPAVANPLPPPAAGCVINADVEGADRRLLDLVTPSVPWVSVLSHRAKPNWSIISRFMIEEAGGLVSPVTSRDARNAELATTLDAKLVLSPFAVAITIMALRGPGEAERAATDPLFRHLNSALHACEQNAAGCHSEQSRQSVQKNENSERLGSWRQSVQKQIKTLVSQGASSTLLRRDVRLASEAALLPGPDATVPVPVHAAGQSYENFVLHALALRLDCLRLSCQHQLGVLASAFLPPTVGVAKRPALVEGSGLLARHAAERSISIAVPRKSDGVAAGTVMARLCTQTAALLLPSTVTVLLIPYATDTSIHKRAHFDDTLTALDLARLALDYRSVVVVVFPSEATPCPTRFPKLKLDNPHLADPTNPLGPLVRQAFLAELCNAASLSPDMRSLSVSRFVDWTLTKTGITLGQGDQRDLQASVTDVLAVCSLVRQAVTLRQAVLFKPTNPTNPLCDFAVIIPCATESRSVLFLWLEMRDRRDSNFGEKLANIAKDELLIAPLATLLEKHYGISVVGTVYLPVTRALFNIGA